MQVSKKSKAPKTPLLVKSNVKSGPPFIIKKED